MALKLSMAVKNARLDSIESAIGTAAALTKKTTGSQITLSLPLVLKTTALSS